MSEVKFCDICGEIIYPTEGFYSIHMHSAATTNTDYLFRDVCKNCVNELILHIKAIAARNGKEPK